MFKIFSSLFAAVRIISSSFFPRNLKNLKFGAFSTATTLFQIILLNFQPYQAVISCKNWYNSVHRFAIKLKKKNHLYFGLIFVQKTNWKIFPKISFELIRCLYAVAILSLHAENQVSLKQYLYTKLAKIYPGIDF